MEHLKLELLIIEWWHNNKEQSKKPPFVTIAEERIAKYTAWVKSNKIEPQALNFLKTEKQWWGIIKECDLILSKYLRSPHTTAYEYLINAKQIPDEQTLTMLKNFQKYFDNLGR